MPEADLLELASRQHGCFSRRQALNAGVGDDAIKQRLNAARWLWLAPGVYGLPGWPGSWMRSLWAAHLDVGPHSVVSHEAAATLHQLTSFRAGALTLTVPHGDHQRVGEATVHQSRDLAASHCTVVGGLPVTTVVRTLVDLAAITGPARLALGAGRRLSIPSMPPR